MAAVTTVHFTGGKLSFSQWERLFAPGEFPTPLSFCTVSDQLSTIVSQSPRVKYMPAVCHALGQELSLCIAFDPHINPVR